MHGIRRVVVFCTLTTILPTLLLVIPLYLRHSFYANVAYAVTESDILEIRDGISTVFCSGHTLKMNGTFNAFQMSHKPEITSSRKHIRLKKSMILPDDTLEYWGFYLLKGATVALSVCSRFQGASILVVKGERDLRTCGMLAHNKNKAKTEGLFLPAAEEQVKIIFESNAQEIYSKEVDGAKDQPEEAKENIDEKERQDLYHAAETYLLNHKSDGHKDQGDDNKQNSTVKLRHARKRLHRVEIERDRKEKEKQKVEEKLKNMLHHHPIGKSLNELEMELNEEETRKRAKRNQDGVKPPSILDQGILHGGNNNNVTWKSDEESSVSSFENGLFNCYEGSILLAEEFAPSQHCLNVSYLMSYKHMQTIHNVAEDGYYYYIFYSDNDFVSNDIHAVFDIYKPTFQYENVTNSCINQTQCTFPLDMFSNDRVIVEIPMRDGIEHEIDDVSILISICHPRTGMYAIFPIAVLFLVLGCAFL